jgi:intein/homing endonuclease
MADGTVKPISDVAVGDLVVTKNDSTGELQVRPVDYVYRNLSSTSDNMYEITLENGTTVKITGNHKVKLTNGRWVRVDDLQEGDDICSDCMI